MLAQTSGAYEVGKFGVAFLIAQAGCLLVSQATRVGSKVLAKTLNGNKPTWQVKRVVMQYTALILCAGAALGIAMNLFASSLIALFTAEYNDALKELRVLSLYPAAYGVCLVLTQYLVLARQQTSYFRGIALSGLVSLLVTVLACRAYGGGGAAVSLVFNTAATACVLAGLSWRHLAVSCLASR